MGIPKIYVVTASIYPLDNLLDLLKNETIQPDKILVIDEGDEKIREKNREILKELDLEKIFFYGPRERTEWFKSRYGSSYEKYLSLIPERSHAETSFGFLVAYEEDAEVVIEVDDDVYSEENYSFVRDHLSNLSDSKGVRISSSSSWVNTIDFLDINQNRSEKIFPRGHPYDPVVREYAYKYKEDSGECVLNMGLWTESPDLDAVTILHYGGLDGVSKIKARRLLIDKVFIDKGSFYAVCSMNTSFKKKLIPAFYQLYMKYMGIDRFDDIWSGLFAKKIADELGDNMCLGKPALKHRKRPRSVWKDLRSELEGMIINEKLWRIVKEAEIRSRSYIDAYRELAEYIEKRINEFSEELHRKFVKFQTEKMILWTEAIVLL
ncbi:MAG: hypothetical protein ACP5GI_02035 [Sulfolobales archaeon]